MVGKRKNPLLGRGSQIVMNSFENGSWLPPRFVDSIPHPINFGQYFSPNFPQIRGPTSEFCLTFWYAASAERVRSACHSTLEYRQNIYYKSRRNYMTTRNLTNTQSSADLTNQSEAKEKTAAPMDSEAHSATAPTEQPEAARQTDCTTPGNRAIRIVMRNTINDAHARQQRLERLTQCFITTTNQSEAKEKTAALMDSEAHSATAPTEQPEAARQSHCNTTRQGAQNEY